ncbi:MAG: hypothetical protein J6U35_01630, partial [Clostridia bacterium]|nr:hypothetical protein [Clostridia bacterium]
SDGLTFSEAKFGETGEGLPFPEDYETDYVFAAHTPAGERIIVAGEGYIFVADPLRPEDGFTRTEAYYSGGLCFANVDLGGNPCCAIVSDVGTMYLYDGESFSAYPCEAGVLSAIGFSGRLALVTSDKAVLSAEGAPYDFSAGEGYSFDLGYEFCAKKAAKYQNEIIIAGVRGICKLGRSDYGSEFRVRPVASEGERFLPETLFAGGEYAYILSERGLATYNGVGLGFSHEEISDTVGAGLGAFIWNGKYHAVLKTPENAHKRLIYAFGKDVEAYDLPIVSTCIGGDGENVYAFVDGVNAVCLLGGKQTHPFPRRVFRTSETDFGVNGQKTLTEFSLRTLRDVRLIITVDGKKKAFRIIGGSGRRRITPFLKGEIFSFEIGCELPSSCISAVRMEIEY